VNSAANGQLPAAAPANQTVSFGLEAQTLLVAPTSSTGFWHLGERRRQLE